VSKYNPSLTIYAGINKNNYEKAVELIKKCVNDMSDRKVLERLFEPAKKTIDTYLNNYYDDSVQQVNNYYLNEFENIEDIENFRKKIDEITIDEVIDVNSKISLSTIYMLKGEN
jgi:predicted Zn-dependent peptidase